MPVVKHEAFFCRHPVFTGDELAAYLTSRGEVGARGQEALLAYYTKTRRVVRVRRGLYAVVPRGANPNAYPIDPYLVAAKLTQDAVLSHHTALEFHGRAYSVWHHLIYSASRPVGSLTFRSQVFRGAKFPKALLRSGTEHFGVLHSERSGVDHARHESGTDTGGCPASPGPVGRLGGNLALVGIGRILRHRPSGGVRAPVGQCDHQRKGGILLRAAPRSLDGRGAPSQATSRSAPSATPLSGPHPTTTRMPRGGLEPDGSKRHT